MRIRMELVSDAIFGNGASIPGAEDIAIQCDAKGFPYYKGGTFKGLFREEFENYLDAVGLAPEEAERETKRLFGQGGDTGDGREKLIFSDLELSGFVKKAVLDEIGGGSPQRVMEVFSHVRTFTRMEENGTGKPGSLRDARCIDKGRIFYGTIQEEGLDEETRQRIREALGFVKSVGSMRNRGFGRVRIREVEE